MESGKEKLKEIVEILLKKEDNYEKIKKACDDLYTLFLEASGLKEEEEENRKHYYLPQGKAIGTFWAGACVKEFLRTKRFIRGVFCGIKRAKKKFLNEQIHILYAGTGPFATLMIPLTTVFTSEEVKFTLLEVNPNTIENLKQVIKAFEAEEYVEEIVECDAAEYKVKKEKPIHMVVTETMQNALKNEPQVSITLNLVPQMEKDGILIPQNISIEAVLLDPKRDTERMMGVEGAEKDFYYPLKTIFELNKENPEYSGRKEKCCFLEKEVELPYGLEERYRRLSLFTNIQVFEEEELSYNQCSLTMPYKVMDIDWKKNDIKKLSFQYVINEKPGFVCKKIEGCIKENEDLICSNFNISLGTSDRVDETVLLKIFKECRPELECISNIPEEQKEAVIAQQFSIEKQQLMIIYPEAELNIIFCDGKPIGRIYIYYGKSTDRILEIGLLKEYRGQGIGQSVIRKVIEKAVDKEKTVSLQVAWFNRDACRLYQKLGFQIVEDKGVVCEMIYDKP